MTKISVFAATGSISVLIMYFTHIVELQINITENFNLNIKTIV